MVSLVESQFTLYDTLSLDTLPSAFHPLLPFSGSTTPVDRDTQVNVTACIDICLMCQFLEILKDYPDIDPSLLAKEDSEIYESLVQKISQKTTEERQKDCATVDAHSDKTTCNRIGFRNALLLTSEKALMEKADEVVLALKETQNRSPENILSYTKVNLNNGDSITGVGTRFVESFKGIPYAEPPIGELRFKHPVPYNKSIDNFQATDFGASCINVTPLGFGSLLKKKVSPLSWMPNWMSDRIITSYFKSVEKTGEDCLFVNVYRPRGVKADSNIPVVVWIYGGAFQFGSSTHYLGDKFIETSMSMKSPIIFVTFNYRLGPWGFLGGPAVHKEGSTNAGLLDQRLALQWVSDNIKSFGGNPDHVTLMGESAGAISIAFHMVSNNGDLSYNGRQLFHAAILESGGAWVFDSVNSQKPTDLFNHFAEYAGCNPEDEGVMDCLRSKSVEELRTAQNFGQAVDENATYDNISTAFFGWGPRYDWGYIPDNPVELFKRGTFAKIPYITGNQEDEGSILTILFNISTEDDVKNFAHQLFTNSTQQEINEVLEMYSPKKAWYKDLMFNKFVSLNMSGFSMFASMVGDIIFHVPRLIQLQNTPDDVPVYVFMASQLKFLPVLGTLHSNELLYQFYLDIYPAEEYRRYFVSFINHYDPNVDTLGLPVWNRYTSKSKSKLVFNLQSPGVTVEEISESTKNLQRLVDNPGKIMI